MKLPMILASSVIFWFFVGCQKEDRANSVRNQVDWERTHLDRIVELDPDDEADFAWANEVGKDKIAKGEVWYCTA
jgi:hypothetical protein